MDLYGVPDYDTPEEFFALKAQKQGRYKKGGIPDVRISARMLIEDWNRYGPVVLYKKVLV